MVSPGLLFAGHRYVSDVLEGLLGAAETRGAVRAFALGLVDAAPTPLRATLHPVADYVGGKCMGYPAIWFLQEVLEEDDAAGVIARCKNALCMSLSTSIADDLADNDEPYDAAYLAFLYVLVGESACAPAPRGAMRARLHAALLACLDLPAHADDALARRGDRIGAFFAMIAGEALDASLPRAEAALAIEAARCFGRFCAHLDDAMDAQRDLEHGAMHNVALQLLRERLGRAPEPADFIREREWLDKRMQRLLLETIDRATAFVGALGATRAVASLSRLRHSAFVAETT
jgi:hypothetical protein